MKICIPSRSKSLDSRIDPRFGRASFLLFLNREGRLEKAVANPGVEAGRQAGIAAGQKVVEEEGRILITSHIGPHALGLLKGGGVEVFSAASAGTAKQAFSFWGEEKLTRIDSATAPPPRSRPRGEGRRRRRGSC